MRRLAALFLILGGMVGIAGAEADAVRIVNEAGTNAVNIAGNEFSIGRIFVTTVVFTNDGSSQTAAGSGSGDVTGVTAGTGLSGGGASGEVTVNLNTGSTNTWTAQQRINNGAGSFNPILIVSTGGTTGTNLFEVNGGSIVVRTGLFNSAGVQYSTGGSGGGSSGVPVQVAPSVGIATGPIFANNNDVRGVNHIVASSITIVTSDNFSVIFTSQPTLYTLASSTFQQSASSISWRDTSGNLLTVKGGTITMTPVATGNNFSAVYGTGPTSGVVSSPFYISQPAGSGFPIFTIATGTARLVEVTGSSLTSRIPIFQAGTQYAAPHYVFDESNPNYKMLPMDELWAYVDEKKQLPGMAPFEGDGLYNAIDYARMLHEKVEEQALYIRMLDERLKALESK